MDLAATARFRLSPNLGSKTSVGGQFFRDQASGVLATGRGLPPGSETITGAGSTEARDTTVESRSLGSFVEQEFGIKERLFVTGALRFDDNSAFGENFDATVYPKASVSWLLSEEPFFDSGFLNTLRLRAAFGVSGQQPGTTDALRFFSPVAGKKDGVAETGDHVRQPGQRRSQAGAVAASSSWASTPSTPRGPGERRVHLLHQETKDALVERIMAPSVGGSSTQFFNLGEVEQPWL